MATEQELQRRRDEEQAARVEARRQAAIGAGHLEWLKLPERRDLARRKAELARLVEKGIEGFGIAGRAVALAKNKVVRFG